MELKKKMNSAGVVYVTSLARYSRRGIFFKVIELIPHPIGVDPCRAPDNGEFIIDKIQTRRWHALPCGVEAIFGIGSVYKVIIEKYVRSRQPYARESPRNRKNQITVRLSQSHFILQREYANVIH